MKREPYKLKCALVNISGTELDCGDSSNGLTFANHFENVIELLHHGVYCLHVIQYPFIKLTANFVQLVLTATGR
jgi:hypothetical protein